MSRSSALHLTSPYGNLLSISQWYRCQNKYRYVVGCRTCWRC